MRDAVTMSNISTQNQSQFDYIETEVLRLLDDRKTEHIEMIDLAHNEARLSDSCIVGSGTSSRHVDSIANSVYKYLKTEKLSPRIEGSGQSGWVLIESAGIEIHLFKPEVREYYYIESLMRSSEKA
jgi:ribosome-associated protein